MKPSPEKLINAITTCNHQRMVQIAKRGLNVDTPDEKGDTPLCVAVDLGFLGEARILLELGANPNHPSLVRGTPLYIAVRAGFDEMLRLLIKHGADIHYRMENGHSYLDIACLESKHVSAVLLMEAGLSLEDSRLTQEQPELVTWLRLSAPALYAAEIGDLNGLKYCLDRGADPNTRGWFRSLLEYAIYRDDNSMVELLLTQGANPNDNVDERRPSPLEIAAGRGKLEIVMTLLRSGATPNRAQPHGASALIRAVQAGSLPIVQSLISAGANVHYRYHTNITALSQAKQNGFMTIVAALIDAGATE